jgi:hypothetical protein
MVRRNIAGHSKKPQGRQFGIAHRGSGRVGEILLRGAQKISVKNPKKQPRSRPLTMDDLTDGEKAELLRRLRDGLSPGQVVKDVYSEGQIQEIAERVVCEMRKPSSLKPS